MIDYHSHSIYSDGKNTYNETLNQAINKNLKEFGFSDHLCIYYPDWAIKKENFQNLINEIIEIKSRKDLPIEIKFGLEVDYIENREDEIQKCLELFPLDYVIGSVHYVGNWNFDTKSNGYQSKDIDEFYKEYYRLIQKAACSGLFDIMGHIDVVKKFNYFPGFDLDTIYEQTAKVFSESNVVIEFNTSGKDKPCKEFYPSREFLQHCYNHEVPVTLGSDAHRTKDVARHFPEALEKLKLIGYTQLASFTNRERKFLDF